MSLKAFHVFFVVVATLMCVGMGVWGVRAATEDARLPLYLGILGFVSAAALAVYGRWFLKKLKRFSYV